MRDAEGSKEQEDSEEQGATATQQDLEGAAETQQDLESNRDSQASPILGDGDGDGDGDDENAGASVCFFVSSWTWHCDTQPS